ncbi:sensor histidine kinase [Actinorugispora endophytica]|uniref:histidine kinase n=1 Tax=Actinorugispora endophytica TaxID=1605990 RepID=A0A4V3D765_9ACTN|nr:sensor histidine kinase [Actinorugispora endophytica]TDQ46597.1 signal transduction histidine kinase [Actinorugispora endophytica]
MNRETARRLAGSVSLAVLLALAALGATHGHAVMGRPGPPEPGAWLAADWGPREMSPLVWLGAAAGAAGVAVRRFRPRTALAVAASGAAVALAGGAAGMVRVMPLVVLFSVAAAYPLRRYAALAPLAVPLVLAPNLDEPYLGALNGELLTDATVTLTLLCASAAFGAAVRVRRESVLHEREQERRRSAYEERLRVAREVHDVVGHSLSVISMQAGVALHVLDKRPEQAVPSLEAIRKTSKDALEELRGTLAVFQDPGGDAARAPVPGLDRLDDLVAALTAAGRGCSVTREGAPVRLPVAVDHAAYRIVQESLTNVVRHAGGAPARVHLAHTPEGVVIEVTDEGPARLGDPVVEGNGLAGMRERARAVGGTVEAGPCPGGGFAVRAHLPGDRSER